MEQQVDEHYRDKQHNGLKVGKEQGEVLVHGPCNNDEQGDHSGRNLDTRPHAHSDGELHLKVSCDRMAATHLSLAGHPHRRDVLSRIADEGKKDEADEPDRQLGNGLMLTSWECAIVERFRRYFRLECRRRTP